MIWYNELSRCPKCGSPQRCLSPVLRNLLLRIATANFGIFGDMWRRGIEKKQQDVIRRTCKRCQFIWDELPPGAK